MERTAYGQPTQPPQLHIIRDEDSPPYDGQTRTERQHFTMMTDEARTRARRHGMAALGLYTDLEGRCNATGRTYATLETIARDFGCSVRHVRDALAKLKAEGLVRVEPTYGPTGLQLGNDIILPLHPNTQSRRNASDLRAEPTPEPTPEPSCAHVMEVSNREVVDNRPTASPNRTATPRRTTYSADFETFWQAYPKGHGSKAESFKVWTTLNVDARLLDDILTGITAWKRTRRWQDGYIKDAERFLKGRLWENPELPMSRKPSQNAGGQGRVVL